MITLTLSQIPPSLNNAYFNLPKGGRAPTTKLRNWKLAAAWEIAAQRPGHIAGEVHIEVAIKRPNSRSDLDNRLKPLWDVLCEVGVISDDSRVKALNARWEQAPGAPAVLIIIKLAIENAEAA